jgi:hypothetical protein
MNVSGRFDRRSTMPLLAAHVSEKGQTGFRTTL